MLGLMQTTSGDLESLIKDGKIEAISSLIESDASIALVPIYFNGRMQRTVDLAAAEEKWEIYKLLLKARLGENQSIDSLYTEELVSSAQHDQVNTMKEILQTAPNLISALGNGNKHIWVEAVTPQYRKEYKVLKFLLNEHKSLISGFNSGGLTLSHIAAEKGNITAVALIHEAMPELSYEVSLEHGHTPLHFAAYESHPHVVNFLLEIAPNLFDISNNDGKTAIHLAGAHRRQETAKVILHHVLSSHTKCTDINKLVHDYLSNEKGLLIDNEEGIIAMHTLKIEEIPNAPADAVVDIQLTIHVDTELGGVEAGSA